MSCTCNQSINCDPCAFCTPPGVTCLTTCAPIDPCPEKIDIDCVIYSGDDHPCSEIENGQPISQIMLQALSLIFPLEECCYFEATVVLIDPPPSQYTFCYSSAINNGSCNKACSCDPTTSNVTVYSLDNPLSPGSLLYTNGTLSTLAPAGWYSANYQCITVAGGSISGVIGAIQSIVSCIVTTTTAAPTTTLAPCYCYTVTIGEISSTIFYVDCAGASQTSIEYDADAVVKICAQSITPNIAYTVGNPTVYCADRISCPTTTTTTTLAPTTTTTTTVPCNCITFTNNTDQARISYRNCTGQIVTDTIAAAPDPTNGEFTIERRCGSSGASNNPKVDIVVGAPCTGTIPVCFISETTTTEACSPWLLYCCGNTNGGVISIQPCYPNVTGTPFAVNNMYRDEQLRNWIVVGSGGTPTSNYAPLTLMYVGTSTLANCQSASVDQLCPGIATTVAPPGARVMKFSATDCLTACASGSSVTVYSNCVVLSISACRLYTDSGLTTPVLTAGYYVDTTTNLVFQVNSSGFLVSQFSCATAPCYTPSTTTPPATTVNTKTVDLRNNVSYSPPLPFNIGLPKIIDVGFVIAPGNLLGFIPAVSWPGGTFSSVSPNQAPYVGTYTSLNTSFPFGIKISNTTTGEGYTGNYSARFYKNGIQVSCVSFPSSVGQQTIDSGQTYSDGDAIIVLVSKVPC